MYVIYKYIMQLTSKPQHGSTHEQDNTPHTTRQHHTPQQGNTTHHNKAITHGNKYTHMATIIYQRAQTFPTKSVTLKTMTRIIGVQPWSEQS
jgi:hypothetical protein